MKTFEEALRATVYGGDLTRKQRRERVRKNDANYSALMEEVENSDLVDEFSDHVAQMILEENEAGKEPLCCMRHAMQEAFMLGLANGVAVGMEMEKQELTEIKSDGN